MSQDSRFVLFAAEHFEEINRNGMMKGATHVHKSWKLSSPNFPKTQNACCSLGLRLQALGAHAVQTHVPLHLLSQMLLQHERPRSRKWSSALLFTPHSISCLKFNDLRGCFNENLRVYQEPATSCLKTQCWRYIVLRSFRVSNVSCHVMHKFYKMQNSWDWSSIQSSVISEPSSKKERDVSLPRFYKTTLVESYRLSGTAELEVRWSLSRFPRPRPPSSIA